MVRENLVISSWEVGFDPLDEEICFLSICRPNEVNKRVGCGVAKRIGASMFEIF